MTSIISTSGLAQIQSMTGAAIAGLGKTNMAAMTPTETSALSAHEIGAAG